MAEDFNDLFCRTCLNHSDELQSLYDSKLSNVLKECTSVEISIDDVSPMICRTCKSTLLTAYEFRQQCLKADAELRNRRIKNELLHDSLNVFDKVKVEIVNRDNDLDGKPLTFLIDNCDGNRDDDQNGDFDEDKNTLDNDANADSENVTEQDLKKVDYYVCVYCTKLFLHKNRLKDHVAIEHKDKFQFKEKKFDCVYCTHVAKGMRDFTKHLNQHHKKKKPSVNCDKCSEMFHEENQRDYHHSKLHGSNECTVCTKNVNKGLYGLRLHLIRHAMHYVRNHRLLSKAMDLQSEEMQDEDELAKFEIRLSDRAGETFNIKRKNIQGLKFKCNFCPRAYGDKKTLQRHVIVHRELLPFQCKDCPKKFAQLNLLTTHVKTTHYTQPIYKCEQCGEGFYVDLVFEKHVERVHYGGVCELCNIPMPTYKKYRRHMVRVHPAEPLLHCQKCDKSFKMKDNFEKHMLRHQGVDFRKICNVCGLKFTNVRLHMYNVHNIGTVNKFTCRRCGETFTDARSSRIHAKQFHRKQHAPEEYIFQCKICDKRLLTKANLDKHYQVIHRNAERIRHCDACGKVFKTKQELDNHVRTHTGERPFPCDYCEMKFRTKKTMVTHRRLHTGEKPYTCDICNKSFSHYSTFAPHKKRHLQNAFFT